MSVTIPDPETGSYIDPTELRVNRKLTQQFILADKKEIVLERRERTANGTGGYTLSAADPLPAQNMRLIPGGRQLPERETPDGTMAQPTHVLMAEWDADMRRWDTFTDDGQTYVLLYVHDKHAYQMKAEVLYQRGAT